MPLYSCYNYLKMKYKYLTKEQIIISLDRLTRFKNTNEKYTRVFSDILINNLTEPQIKKSDIINMDYTELTSLAEKIFNESIKYISGLKDINNDLTINNIIKDYENSVYINDTDTQKLLNNNLLYKYAVDLISENCPINLKWLKIITENKINNTKSLPDLREKYIIKYPIEKIVLTEGITEEILLPAFSKYLGYDFDQKGIQIIPAGGKNQVVKMYYKLIEEVRSPIFILLDKDGEDNIKQISPKLRNIDRIHLVSCGEFEDLLSKSLIVKTVNKDFENFLSVTTNDLPNDIPTVKVLEELFKTKGLHEFKKADFAKLIKENITSDSDISDEIKNIVNELRE